MLSGSRDEVIPPSHMQLLWDIANAGETRKHSRFVDFPHGTHSENIHVMFQLLASDFEHR